jgi:hypothetical protein
VTQLGRYRFIAQVTDRGELSKPFALEGIRVEDVAELSSDRYGKRIEGAVARVEAEEVVEHLETLDERILAALSKRRKSAGNKPAPEAPAAPAAKPPRSLRVQGGIDRA